MISDDRKKKTELPLFFNVNSRRLPNRDYLIPEGSSDERRVLLGLADVLFAYAYDHRTTGGDATVESAWTVAVLSPLLSWLEVGLGDLACDVGA